MKSVTLFFIIRVNIGYLAQEVPSEDRSPLDIILQQDTQSLEELVDVEYGV